MIILTLFICISFSVSIKNIGEPCIVSHFCNNDTDCDRPCIDGACVTNSRLNCLALSTRCRVRTSTCVDCLQHTDCPSFKPYCDRFFSNNYDIEYKCQECFVDSHCQSENNCNARCEGNTCVSDYEVVDCTKTPETPKCNKDKGICQRCTLEGHCSNETFLKRCYAGECHQCTSNRDCRHDGNCDSECVEQNGKLICVNAAQPLICCGNKECNLHKGVCRDRPNEGSLTTSNVLVLVISGMICFILQQCK